ncbi:DUF1765-domain-containing protein, partial [Saccharata proteae CBS 121410]
PRTPEAVHLPRSASYTYFPQVKDLDYDDPKVVELKGKISEDELSTSIAGGGDGESYSSSGHSTPPEAEPNATTTPETPPARPPVSRRLSLGRFRSYSKTDVRGNGTAEKERPDKGQGAEKQTQEADADKSTLQRSLTQLRRKSWVPSTSRSTSPSKAKGEDSPERKNADKAEKRRSFVNPSRRKSLIGGWRESETDSADGPITALSKKGTVLSKRPRRPSNAVLKATRSEESIPEIQQVPQSKTPSSPKVVLPKSFSTDKLPSLTRSPPSSEAIPPVPRALSSEKLKAFAAEVPRKKDELYGVFRQLDADHSKFANKSVSYKANFVRAQLLPVLRQHASHPSNRRLRPEDLDRRTNILNKWWNGLLEMLHGKNNQSISGADRPAVLDGIVGIMERPEWRLHPSPFCPLAERNAPALGSRSTSTTSLASMEADFLSESVFHNVRNTFTRNLLTQMTIVVEKMSLRNAAASMVSFCGKTCAYAFFFCPGVAELLVRLWTPSLDTMRRVLDEAHVPKHTKLDDASKQIQALFPPHLQSLCLTSLVRAFRGLRKPAPPPLGTQHLPWNGSWTKRWAGSETDLFYVFVKYYHILVTEFLPTETSNIERVCVPGLVMVHAQILANLDDTLHRNSTPHQDESQQGIQPITFDDVLSEGPDASASALPKLPSNATRMMAENRLIMLLRDFLSPRNQHLDTARHMFAEIFSSLLQASARRVSMYDHNGSYTLCDFLEEAMGILMRYEHACPEKPSVLNWAFWLSVFRRMAGSENTTTEIRLYAFLYSIWGTVVDQQGRKAELCRELLLEPEFFESRFNHWCPMVRAYYMRLICWRLARFDGEAEEAGRDFVVLQGLEDRLRSVWSHFLYLQDTAVAQNTPLPSTAPCNPAPGRRLLIIRTDAPLSPTNGPFLSFDGIVSDNPASQPTAYKSHSSLSTQLGESTDLRPASAASIASDSSDKEGADDGGGKRRWGLFRSLMGATKSARTKARSPGPTAATKDDSNTTTGAVAAAAASTAIATTTVSAPPHRTFCFRFSLEYVDKRFQYAAGNMRLSPPRLPAPAHAFLQSTPPGSGRTRSHSKPARPTGAAAVSSRYAGRALAEWTIVVGECQSFFERRKNEGVPSDGRVETPTLGVEVFRRPG